MILLTSARNASTNAVCGLLDGGTGAGYIQLETSGDSEVATLPLSATAFQSSSDGTAEANGITSDTNATGGTVDHASFYDGDDAKHFEATVTTSGGGGDIVASSVNIGAGDTVSMDTLEYTTPAGP